VELVYLPVPRAVECLGKKEKGQHHGHNFELKRLNDEYKREKRKFKELRFDIGANCAAFREKQEKESLKRKETRKAVKDAQEALVKADLESGFSTKMIQNKHRPVVFKIVFNGDTNVSGIDSLTTQITICLKLGSKHDTVCIVVTSPGGSVTGYGLASSQLARIKKAGMELIICVDSVAASGGYMMATMGHKIYAAPFAMVGSIGVVSIIPNFQEFLEKHNVHAFVLTAGKYKRTIDIVGEVTDEGKKKAVEELERIHQVFKDHICHNRPALLGEIENIATGEAWLAIEGKRLGLVDEIMTSDEYLLDMAKTHDIISVEEKSRKKWWSADQFIQYASSVVSRLKSSTGEASTRVETMAI